MKNIAQWQAEVKERPKVWAVFDRYRGEESLADIYDTKEAAELHASWLSSPNRSVKSKCVVRELPLMNMKLVQDRFGDAEGKSGSQP